MRYLMRHAAALQSPGHNVQLAEERLDKVEQLLSLRRQREGAALKQGHAQERFQLNDLPADGRLLDAVGHVAHRLADAAVFGHVEEQLQVMHIHCHPAGVPGIGSRTKPKTLN